MANDDGDEDAEWADAAEYAEGADAADDTGDDADVVHPNSPMLMHDWNTEIRWDVHRSRM